VSEIDGREKCVRLRCAEAPHVFVHLTTIDRIR
jgi:hypothetical protein